MNNHVLDYISYFQGTVHTHSYAFLPSRQPVTIFVGIQSVSYVFKLWKMIPLELLHRKQD